MKTEYDMNLRVFFEKNKNWPLVKKITSVLKSKGFTAYLAGGCVRDALLKRAPKDFDIATSARPEDISPLFPNSNKQGKAFGVVAVFGPAGPVEVATFRKDGPYTDGRHPEYVKFLSEKEDALRRDFTVNALFYNLKTKKVIDYTGGVKDIQKKVIRTVGDPEKRFQEDHLRILRAVRFSLRLAFEIEPVTLKTLFKMKGLLLKISRERVYEECLKILSGAGTGFNMDPLKPLSENPAQNLTLLAGKTGNFEKALTAFKDLGLLDCFLFKPGEDSSKNGSTNRTIRTDGLKSAGEDSSKGNINWEFCLKFWNKPAPTDLLEKKPFLWVRAFFPLWIEKEKEFLNKDGKWRPTFSKNLKEWKFPVALIRAMNNIFYSSLCLLNIREASLGKKLRMLNSGYSEALLFLCKNYLRNKRLNTDIIDKIKTEFSAFEGKLPGPLINGHDLEVLKVPKNESRALLLEQLYDIQLERKIKDKTKLLSIARSLI